MAGEDSEIGQPVFTRGTRIEAPEMGMMASLGFGTCPVLRKVKVGVFSTGDEVQAPGSEQNQTLSTIQTVLLLSVCFRS